MYLKRGGVRTKDNEARNSGVSSWPDKPMARATWIFSTPGSSILEYRDTWVWSKESRSLLKLKLEAFKNSIAKISTEAAAVDFSRLKIKLEVYPPHPLN